MKGKDKCRMLKQIRKQIADANDIPYVVEECPYQGECKGTCPKCEAELKKMEEELSLRRKLGKTVAIAGVAVGVMASVTACTPGDIEDILSSLRPDKSYQKLDGDVPYEGGLAEQEPYQLTGSVVDPNAYPIEDEEGDVAGPLYEDGSNEKDDCIGNDCFEEMSPSEGE